MMNNIREEDTEITPMFEQKKRNFTVSQKIANRYDLYLTDVIEEASNYYDWFKILSRASESDEVYIHIACNGGSVSVGSMIIEAIASTQADVVACIEGYCCSMATQIALACNSWSIGDNSVFMVHNGSYGQFGKSSDNYVYSDFSKKWSLKRSLEIYKYFMTEQEITEMENGKDFWFDADETVERFERVTEGRNKEAKEKMLANRAKVMEENGYIEDENGNYIKKENLEEKPKKVTKKAKDEPAK